MIVESYEDVIHLSGALRSNFWETIHTAISLLLKRHPSGVIIDCSALTECTPAGAETFRSAMEYIDAHDARVIVTAVPEHVMDVLKSVPEVRSQLAIAATIEEARRSLDLLDEPEEMNPKKKKRRLGHDPTSHILACMTGNGSDQAVLDLAAELAVRHGAGVMALYPIIVPRDLPLQAPMGENEETAQRVLQNAEHCCEEQEVHHRLQVERARDVASAIVQALEENPAEKVVVGLPTVDDGDLITPKLVTSVLNKVDRQVMFVRAKMDPRL